MSNEITVSINCSLQEIYNLLENKGFSIVDKYNMEDIYYIQKDIDIKKQAIEEILKNYVLIRKVTQFISDNFVDSYNVNKLIFKSKEIASDGSIIRQDKKDCIIKYIYEGIEFIKALGYKELMTIKEKAIVYGKDDLQLVIKDVENSENLIEIETKENNKKLDTIDKLKNIVRELQIPIKANNYFVKKAEIELKKLINNKDKIVIYLHNKLYFCLVFYIKNIKHFRRNVYG